MINFELIGKHSFRWNYNILKKNIQGRFNKLKKQLLIIYDNQKSYFMNYIVRKTPHEFKPSVSLLNMYSGRQLNERKVLKAYLSSHLEDFRIQAAYYNKNKNNYPQLSSPVLHFGSDSNYHNKLLQSFKKWFKSNFVQAKGLIDQKQFWLRQVRNTQDLLHELSQKVLLKKTNLDQLKTEKYCEVTLILFLITQINLMIYLFGKRQFSSVKLLISKSKTIVSLLYQQNQRTHSAILQNLATIQKLHYQQEKQMKKHLLNSRVASLKGFGNNAISQYQKKRHQQNTQRVNDFQCEQAISKKYSKKIDQIIEQNKIKLSEKHRIQNWLVDIQGKIVLLENRLVFSTAPDIDQIALKAIEPKIFLSQKLNKTFRQSFSDNSGKQSYFNLVFSQKSSSQKSIYLSISKNKKSMDVTLKDFYNVCLVMKKLNQNREAIVYFQILAYHFKKKQFLNQYCFRNSLDDFHQHRDQNDSEDSSIFQDKVIGRKLLQKFIKSEQLLKILLLSLINLVQLYSKQNAHFWSVQTLKYLSEIIQLQILSNLNSIYGFLAEDRVFSDDEEQKLENELQTVEQNQCAKLIKKYNILLQEIKFRIIKNSFNPFSRQIIVNSQNKTEKLLNVRSQRSTVSYRTSVNMKKLQDKQNQLNSLIYQAMNSGLSNKLYQTSIQTPKQIEKSGFNKVSLLASIKLQQQSSQKRQKGAAYGLKRKKGNPTTNVQSVFRKHKEMSEKDTINSNNKKDQSKNQSKTKMQVKFAFVPSSTFLPSSASIDTEKIINHHTNSKKQNTLNFLQTSKSITPSTKTTHLCEYRQKLLQNKEQLEQHIKLSFLKLATNLKNPYSSAISLDQVKVDNFDIALNIDEVLNDFNELLKSLKSLKSFYQESFQREILIQAKFKLFEMIKSKTRNEKLIDMCLQLLSDTNLLKSTQKRLFMKKKILWELADNYYAIKQFKKCISTYLELARMGESSGYLKIAEIYMSTKDYNNSIRFHQKYASEKNNDLESKVKLAHAYSKVPQYYMKTMDMLTSILIASGSSSKFKTQIYERRQNDHLIQSAVILLSSLHFKNENIEKAIQLCQNYCKINIKNYRVLHLLGGYYKFRKNKKKAFASYLNALSNNPTHHKSLIQLTEFICQGQQYKAHAIQLLRKCYCLEPRNLQLLTTLIKFLGGNTQQKITENELHYTTLINFAQILKNTQNKNYSSYNFYEESSLVYQWALSILDKNISIANLDQIEQIYKNLGQISLKTGDYTKSQTYYKLYLLEIQKYVNRSHLNQKLRLEKISKTKISIFYFLGKIKKLQKSYKKAIDYFEKSFQIQKRFEEKLPNMDSYFHWFEVGHCYFSLGQYEIAVKKFLNQRDYVLHFINSLDETFFQEQINSSLVVPVYLQLKSKKIINKVSYLKQIKFELNQTPQNMIYDENDVQSDKVQYVFKKNYFQNQLYLAFCFDKLRRFIESKEIYKKILNFFNEVEQNLEQKQKLRRTGKKIQIKDQKTRKRQTYFKSISNHFNGLNDEFKNFKKICLINLANIYKIQGLENKCNDLMEEYCELCPQNQIHSTSTNIHDFCQNQDNLLNSFKKKVSPTVQQCLNEGKQFNISLEDLGNLNLPQKTIFKNQHNNFQTYQ